MKFIKWELSTTSYAIRIDDSLYFLRLKIVRGNIVENYTIL